MRDDLLRTRDLCVQLATSEEPTPEDYVGMTLATVNEAIAGGSFDLSNPRRSLMLLNLKLAGMGSKENVEKIV